MHANIAIGEGVVTIGRDQYLIRPSFTALASIGTPDDLQEAMTYVIDGYHRIKENQGIHHDHVSFSAHVLSCCSEIPDHWLGSSVRTRNGWKWKVAVRNGKTVITDREIVILAHHCIKWGVMGDDSIKPPKSKKDPEPESENKPFDPMDFVSIAIMPYDSGGLGLQPREAWQLTMAEFQRICESRRKAMRGNKPEPPSEEETEAAFEWAENAIARSKK